jgi:hypothetical protein
LEGQIPADSSSLRFWIDWDFIGRGGRLEITYRGQKRGAILYLACLAIVCSVAHAQDQPNTRPAQSETTQQDQSSQNPASQEQALPEQTTQEPPQNQPQQSQPVQEQQPAQNQTPPNPLPQNPPPQTDQKNDKAGQETRKKSDISTEAVDVTRKFGEDTLNKVVDWEKGWLTGPYVGKNRQLVAMTAQQRREIYLQETFTTPSDYFKRMVSAAADQWRDSPSQWPEGWGGYGERFASREGQFIAANSLAALGDAALKYEPRYDQCKCSGFRLRTRHAILRNFLTYNQSEQELRPQWALYGGAFAGGVISSAWKPYPRNVLADGGWGVLGQAGYGALLNFFTEFAGDINRKLARKR